MNPRRIFFFAAVPLLAAIIPASAAVFSELPIADAFVRAALPDANYGIGGTLSVAGPDATGAGGVKNGAFNTFLQFSTAASSSAFDAEFGAGLWRISEAVLKLNSAAATGNAIFNSGPGNFAITWISRDDWQEGDGKPNSPGVNGLTWNQAVALPTVGTDQPLGQFTSPGTDTVLHSSLALPSGFTADLMSGGTVSLRLAAADSTIGLNFRSRDFQGGSDLWPTLILTAAAIPEPSGSVLLLLCGSMLLVRRHPYPARP